ncbi:hypothetical protein [Lawsonella clevelandensis]|uniref:hypothetical protein n=1 Tax=Lawsonella clevelandensis TaxID=1528099 RepID=UPI002912BFEC|nr:hypothetical protein [Lawsonella clevelandensis]MDU7194124.1 hypothetical protein [Lawsonella clevelandensis]
MDDYTIFIDVEGASADEVTVVFSEQAHGNIIDKALPVVLSIPEDPTNSDPNYAGKALVKMRQYENYVGIMVRLPYASGYESWCDLIWGTLTSAMPHHMRLEVQDRHDHIVYEAERPAVSAEKPVA